MAARANTIRVKIAVAVDPDGDWNSSGWRDGSPEGMIAFASGPFDSSQVTWVEADVPIPDPPVSEQAAQGTTAPAERRRA
mgnify:CR=1 FL=1